MTGSKLILKGCFNNLGEALNGARQQFGDRIAFVDGDERISFKAWIDAADSLAEHLVKRDIKPGDVVVIILPSSIDYAICFAAIARLGAIPTGINLRLGPNEKEGILKLCTSKLVIAAEKPEYMPDNTSLLLRSELPAMTTSLSPVHHDNNRGKDDAAVIIWTSGTTGMPKGAWFDNSALQAVAKYASPMSAPYDSRLIQNSFAHAGFMGRVWDQLAYGVTFVIAPQPWSAKDTMDLLLRENLSVVVAAPTQWAKLLEQEDFNAKNLAHLRLCITSTAPCPPDLAKQIIDRVRRPVITRYAMTECPSIAGTNENDPPEVLFETVGRPMEGVEVELRDENGKVVLRNEVGRVYVRSETMMRGYWSDDEMTRETLVEGGWLKTGDLARFDKNGRIILVSRASDMYIRGGYNIYPLEVENALSQHPGISKVAIIGKATPVIGEIGIAFIVPENPKVPPTLDEVRAWCKARIADYKAPDEIRIVESLPVTAMMKIDKKELANQVA